MSAIEEAVRVDVASTDGTQTFSFAGSGTLRRDARGVHLQYAARNEAGDTVVSSLHIGAGRALVDAGAYRLLLDPGHPTQARISAQGGTLALTVTAHLVHADLIGSRGTITLHYTLSNRDRALQEMQVRLALTPME